MHAIIVNPTPDGRDVVQRHEVDGEPADLSFAQMGGIVNDPTEPTKGKAMLERLQFNWGEMWCDEEGRLTQRPVNLLATRLARQGYPIVGPVVLRFKKGYNLDPRTHTVIRYKKDGTFVAA